MKGRRWGFLSFLLFCVIGGSLFFSRVLSQGGERPHVGRWARELFHGVRHEPKVFDCFPFFNELDLLEMRLSELYDVVDHFILVEATRTFQNNPKPLYFQENQERFAPFADKIVHVVVDTYPEFPPIGDQKDYHEVEIWQRNHIKNGLKRCRPHPKDIVMITDVDEIIRKEKVALIRTLIATEGNDVVFGEFDFFRHFLNRKVEEPWRVSVATSWGLFDRYISNATAFRCLGWFTFGDIFDFLEKVKERHPRKKWLFARVPKIGWHFSSIGDHAAYMQKLHACAHIREAEWTRTAQELRAAINQLTYCEITPTFPDYLLQHQKELIEKGLIDTP